MKKSKLIGLMAALPLILSSCVIQSYHHTTGNPIGTKQGVVKSKLMGDFDAGIGAAAKEGKITKIGSVDIKVMAPFMQVMVIVTGE